MNIGLLNTPISITKNEVAVDAIGNHKNAWVPYYHCHATVSSEAGKENTDAGLVIDSSKIDFTIRWCKKPPPLTLHITEWSLMVSFMISKLSTT